MLVSWAGFAFTMFTQVEKNFSMGLFLASMVWTPICGVTIYYFAKSLLTPVVQIYRKDIVVSVLRRKIIPVAEVVKLEVMPRKILIEFLDKGEFKRISVPVDEHYYQKSSIIDGKFKD